MEYIGIYYIYKSKKKMYVLKKKIFPIVGYIIY